jgi:hypothetical protein
MARQAPGAITSLTEMASSMLDAGHAQAQEVGCCHLGRHNRAHGRSNDSIDAVMQLALLPKQSLARPCAAMHTCHRKMSQHFQTS